MNVFRQKSAPKENALHTKEAPADDRGPVTHQPIMTPPADYSPPSRPALDDAQKEKVDKLRAAMQAIMLPEDHEYYPNEKGFLTDGTFNRYLRARKWDFEVKENPGNSSSFWLTGHGRLPKPCWRTQSSGGASIDPTSSTPIIFGPR